jgi:hypothetical protein
VQSVSIDQIDVPPEHSPETDPESGYVQQRRRSPPFDQQVHVTAAIRFPTANRAEDPDLLNPKALGKP